MQTLRHTPVITAAAWTQEQRAQAMQRSIKHQSDLVAQARYSADHGNREAAAQAMQLYRAEHTAYQWLARVQLNTTTI